MLTSVACFTDHDKVADLPAFMVGGSAAKVSMTAGCGLGGGPPLSTTTGGVGIGVGCVGQAKYPTTPAASSATTRATGTHGNLPACRGGSVLVSGSSSGRFRIVSAMMGS